MAATQIKNGFNGGSDDQLLVNPDGSINVNVTDGGGVASDVNIHDSSGNSISSTGGALDVNISSDTGFDTLTPGTPTQVSVNTNSTLLFSANPNRKYAHIVNNSPDLIYIQYQVSAALNQGIKISSGGFYTIESNNLWLGIVNAIGVMSNQLIDILEGE